MTEDFDLMEGFAEESKQPPKAVPRMKPKDLVKFVREFDAGMIFSSAHIDPNSLHSMIPLVFMPIALGALAHYAEEELKKMGRRLRMSKAIGITPPNRLLGGTVSGEEFYETIENDPGRHGDDDSADGMTVETDVVTDFEVENTSSKRKPISQKPRPRRNKKNAATKEAK